MRVFQMQRLAIILFLYAVGGLEISIPSLPSESWKAALVCRHIMHESDWISIATLSTQNAIKGYPFVSLESMSDGPKTNSTGVPYLYMTPLDTPSIDIMNDDRVSIMASLAQSDYCKKENLDPEDPRCARVMISGTFKKIEKSFPEYDFALMSLFERHPVMRKWPKGHAFYPAKIDIQQIQLFDNFGGVKQVTPKEYFDVNITNILNMNLNFDKIFIVDVTTV
ncbi:cellular Repressor of E1A-stimulated Genes [Leptinotarsa decemlineata]|uniref:cellular Repressor of E1A-stimulated Genes n=1 Tax=Leptinotarsa decemlineata TaxID=7539 RepID=UPI003D308432